MEIADQNIVTGFFAACNKNNQITFDRWEDECFVFARGFGKDAGISAQETADTAIMAHRVLRKKQFYFEARLRLLKQQFKIVIRKLLRLQKQKIHPQASLTIMDCSDWSYWINSMSNDRVYLWREQKLVRLVPKDLTDTQLSQIFLKRSQIAGLYTVLGEHHSGDIFLLMTKELSLTVNEKKLEEMLIGAFKKQMLPQELAINLVKEAQKRRKQDNFAVLVARVLRDNPK